MGELCGTHTTLLILRCEAPTGPAFGRPDDRLRAEPRRTHTAAAASHLHPPDRHHAAHALGRALRIAEQSRAVGEAEELGEVDGRAGALLAAGHGEVVLVAVEI